ncbi:hypothetical protein [Limnoglobus roseus]|uniref:Uncharacterized protein n=1 Tax=Limnoglobus roseus TaxID=2598579 RepID=A0A5C1AR44_9BACT|nr:hypothetical protein [Limnoglobus roseus]QEL20677.1 hypothetical protein PX52LOC_07784 [Limnoglobus roseus]
MTTELTIEREFHFARRGRGYRKVLEEGPVPAATAGVRVPKVSRWLALAIRIDRLVRDGAIANYAEAARLGQVTRARVSQIVSLLNLAPDVQEAVLHLPPTDAGRDAVTFRELLPIAAVANWDGQRTLWAVVAARLPVTPGSSARGSGRRSASPT